MLQRWTRVLMVIGLVAVVGAMSLLQASADQSYLMGECTAVVNPDHPTLGAWKYCVEVNWNTGRHALSHLDLLLGLEACPCVCEEFPFAAQDPAGVSTGESGQGEVCLVFYRAGWSCAGDPSLGIGVPLIKFESIAQGDCEPGPVGEGTFCFYSNWPPVAVATPNELLALKAGPNMVTGELTGVMPDCGCGMAPVESCTWGAVKAQFTR